MKIDLLNSKNFFDKLLECVVAAVTKVLGNPEYVSNDNTEVEIKRDYENKSKVDVTIVDRNNMVFTYPGQSRFLGSDKHFIVRDTYSFKSIEAFNRFFNNLRSRKNAKGYQCKLNEMMLEYFSARKFTDDNTVHRRFAIEFKFDISHLENKDWIYLNNADIVIGHASNAAQMPHVNGESGIRELSMKFLLENCLEDNFSCAVIYDIVDNEHINHKYYSSMFASVPDLTEVKRSNVRKRRSVQVQDNGISRIIVQRDVNSQLTVKTDRVELEEAEKLGIYTSHEEALSNGRPDLLQQSRITELNHELEIQRMQNNVHRERIIAIEHESKEKNHAMTNHRDAVELLKKQLDSANKLTEELHHRQMEREKEDRNRREEERKAEDEKRKSEQAEKQENKSSKRKDKSEKIKFTLGMITSIVSLAVGLFTIFKRA